MWLGLAQSRNTPYVPFYGNVEDTTKLSRTVLLNMTENLGIGLFGILTKWLWKYPEIFGNSIQEKWKEKEAEWDKEQTRTRRQICKLQ